MEPSTGEAHSSTLSLAAQQNHALALLAEADHDCTPLAVWHNIAVSKRCSVDGAPSSSLLGVWLQRLRNGNALKGSFDQSLSDEPENQVSSLCTISAVSPSVECPKNLPPTSRHIATPAVTSSVLVSDVQSRRPDTTDDYFEDRLHVNNHTSTTFLPFCSVIQDSEPPLDSTNSLTPTGKTCPPPRFSSPLRQLPKLPLSSIPPNSTPSPNRQSQPLNSQTEGNQFESPRPHFSKSGSRHIYSPGELRRLRHNRRRSLPEGDPVALKSIVGSKLPSLSFNPSETLTADVLLSGVDAGLTFSDLGFSASIVSALSSIGFIHPSPVQLRAIPRARLGGDIIAHAKSGTGKTLAYVLAILDAHVSERVSPRGPPRTLVMVPTRELATQVSALFSSVGSRLPSPLSVATLVGGTDERLDARLLSEDLPVVVVGTPGRIRALATSAVLLLHAITVLVLDEGDRLLESAFGNDIRVICDLIPDVHQTLAFSATFPSWLRHILLDIMRNPAYITIEDSNIQEPCNLVTVGNKSNDDVNNVQKVVLLGVRQDKTAAGNYDSTSTLSSNLTVKLDVLIRLLGSETFTLCIVFVSNRKSVPVVEERLKTTSLTHRGICASMKQSVRKSAMTTVREGKVQVLVATDLLARGVDLPTCDLVIHLDVPADVATYLHRVGRAGRFGGQGRSVIIYDINQEIGSITHLEENLGYCINTVNLPDQSDSSAMNVLRQSPQQITYAPDESKLRTKGHTITEDDLKIDDVVESADTITIKNSGAIHKQIPETRTIIKTRGSNIVGGDEKNRFCQKKSSSSNTLELFPSDVITASQAKATKSHKIAPISENEGKFTLHSTTQKDVSMSKNFGQEPDEIIQPNLAACHHKDAIKKKRRAVVMGEPGWTVPNKRHLGNRASTDSHYVTKNDRNEDQSSVLYAGSTIPGGLSTDDREAWKIYAEDAHKQGYNDAYARAFRMATELCKRLRG